MPGWDCHGLPIENAIEKLHGRNLPRDEVQAKSRAFATEQIDGQRADFKRLGVLGEWDNPYRTMDFGNEANEIRALKRIMERGFVYRGLKPVYWCFDCGSSLAEFEIEYADKKSQTLDVGFKCAEPQKLALAFGQATLGKDAFAVIWTTTAWTIPANQALNLNPDLEYSLVDTERGLLVLASVLVEKCLERFQLEGRVIAVTKGENLAKINFEHPFYDVDPGYKRFSPVFLADYATADDGTGIVHSSPAYGVEDFNSCVSNGIAHEDILNPVQGNGRYVDELPMFGGLNIWKAAPLVIEKLREHGRLFATQDILHSYPHCWRHKTPVIYRAAAQWFIRMDGETAGTQGVFASDKAGKTLRELALAAIEETSFYPENGKVRLRDMIAGRPDWCISRQRNWGVPLPFFIHTATGELHPRTMEIMDQAARMVEAGGIEAWSKASAESILGAEARRLHQEHRHPRRLVRLRHHARPRAAPQPRRAVDLAGRPVPRRPRPAPRLVPFLAAHRLRDVRPRALQGPAHARLHRRRQGPQDEQERRQRRRCRRKSATSWARRSSACGCASTDYSGDLGIDDKILARVVDAYRRIRNTLRFLMANVSDFDPAKDAVPLEQMLEIDRYALSRAAQLQADILAHYEVYEFHPVVSKLQIYCSEDLGSFYLDILKDRLYTTGPKSLARRSAQTALWRITHAMLRWMAPFLSFTAEEAWKVVSSVPGESIFMETYAEFPAPDAALLAKWARIRELRDAVNKDIETLRADGKVGSSLQANVVLKVPAEDHALLAGLGEDLKFVFITSAIEVAAGERCFDEGDAQHRCQVRALLALPRRRGPRPGPPDDLRPLHQQPVRRR